MGRYVERAENIARLLTVTEAFESSDEAQNAWETLLKVFAAEKEFEKSKKPKTPANIAGFFLTRSDSQTSIYFCLKGVRENARSLRHLISTEAWVQISEVFTRTAATANKRVALSKLNAVCEEIRRDCLAHYGIMQATCYRDEAWLFHRIGVALERADQMTRLLDMKYFQIDSNEDTPDAQPPDAIWWNTLLRSAGGYHAFRRRHSFNPKTEEAAAFFLFDEDFPRSVSAALSDSFKCLTELERDYKATTNEAVTVAGQSLAGLMKDHPKRLRGKALHRFLDSVQSGIIDYANAISNRYFTA